MASWARRSPPAWEIEQAKWAVVLATRRLPPGCWPGEERVLELALGGLSRAVSRGEHEERVAAILALGWLRDERAISPLVRGLRDGSWQVRWAAAASLGDFATLPAWVFAPLRSAAQDECVPVRGTVARALVRVKSPVGERGPRREGGRG